jgi:hypothetical protein
MIEQHCNFFSFTPIIPLCAVSISSALLIVLSNSKLFNIWLVRFFEIERVMSEFLSLDSFLTGHNPPREDVHVRLEQKSGAGVVVWA